MNKLILLSILIISLGCSNGQNDIGLISKTTFSVNKLQGEPYNIILSLEKLNESEYNLIAKIEMDSMSYMASISESSMKGIFKVNFLDSININSSFPLKEIKHSGASNFIGVGYSHNIVTSNVTYNQKFKINSHYNFKSTGMIEFVIEPRCTLEKIPFSLTYKNGKLSLKS